MCQNFIFSFFLCLFSFYPFSHRLPIQSLEIPRTAAHCAQCSSHSPSHRDSKDPPHAWFSKVTAIETSFRFSFHLFSKDFDWLLYCDFYFSPTSLPYQIYDQPAFWRGRHVDFPCRNTRFASNWNKFQIVIHIVVSISFLLCSIVFIDCSFRWNVITYQPRQLCCHTNFA